MLIPPHALDLCLSFVNTRMWRGRIDPAETLHDLVGVLTWLERSARLHTRDLEQVRRWSEDNARAAGNVFAQVIALRETICRIFDALALGKPVQAHDVSALNRALAAAPCRTRIERADGKFGWAVDPPSWSAAELLAPVLWSASDLLMHAGQRRVRLCANAQCRWLFVDESKGGTRRWCDMASCGNRAKAQRHYRRRKQGAGATSG